MSNLKNLLHKWLERPGNTEAKLAYMLGYRTKTTVYNWRKRGVPKRKREIVKAILKGSME